MYCISRWYLPDCKHIREENTYVYNDCLWPTMVDIILCVFFRKIFPLTKETPEGKSVPNTVQCAERDTSMDSMEVILVLMQHFKVGDATENNGRIILTWSYPW